MGRDGHAQVVGLQHSRVPGGNVFQAIVDGMVTHVADHGFGAGDGMLRELAYTGRQFGAEEARSIGLVNRVYPDHEQLLAGVLEIAHQIAAKSPIAVTGTKAMISYMRDHTVNDGLEYVATWNSAMLQSNDLRVAIAAHMSKQKPEFVD